MTTSSMLSSSTINQPPYFFYEDNMTTEFSMQAIKLSGDGIADFEGEVWDIAIDNSGRMLVAGINQSPMWARSGTAPVTSPTKTTGSCTTSHRSLQTFRSNATRFYGACRYGNLMVAVGDFSQQSRGYHGLSTKTLAFMDLCRIRNRSLSRCQM